MASAASKFMKKRSASWCRWVLWAREKPQEGLSRHARCESPPYSVSSSCSFASRQSGCLLQSRGPKAHWEHSGWLWNQSFSEVCSSFCDVCSSFCDVHRDLRSRSCRRRSCTLKASQEKRQAFDIGNNCSERRIGISTLLGLHRRTSCSNLGQTGQRQFQEIRQAKASAKTSWYPAVLWHAESPVDSWTPTTGMDAWHSHFPCKQTTITISSLSTARPVK